MMYITDWRLDVDATLHECIVQYSMDRDVLYISTVLPSARRRASNLANSSAAIASSADTICSTPFTSGICAREK